MKIEIKNEEICFLYLTLEKNRYKMFITLWEKTSSCLVNFYRERGVVRASQNTKHMKPLFECSRYQLPKKMIKKWVILDQIRWNHGCILVLMKFTHRGIPNYFGLYKSLFLYVFYIKDFFKIKGENYEWIRRKTNDVQT